ncbi:tRNA(Arg) A34 adenosine deaminase TadA [Filimonas zeae]|uniref:tRNA-specific adenosine deaminase n=1 Tax=Filimonas zeae TaxID=1737353 RepID=A0A917IR10_9BACT|nr:nucleoside deaminase [Filimonas zeae]MDR6337876.1 tRNA(Arg) A34 adenosine deaminase TadA [Filimonas zeae]GGH60672.1 tRNA-specific adenosine deaminase [Filimonas zeae]
MEREAKFMQEAIRLSRKGMENGDGGPFGCVVVKGEEIVGRGWNRVTSTNDPTAHAEVVAIRDACANMGTFQLEGCEVYTSCEPCPMCLGAIYWARPAKLYYANTRFDAAEAGFDDAFIYEELPLRAEDRKIATTCLCREDALPVFREWQLKMDRKDY